MCSVADPNTSLKPVAAAPIKLSTNCVKCDQKALHVVGTNGTFCSDCFEKHFTHKFRAAMGKNPVIRHGNKVLIAFSGGASSSALLHLVKQGLDPTAARRLKFIPGIIFVDESCVMPEENLDVSIDEIVAIMKKTGFPHYIVKLEDVFELTEACKQSNRQHAKREKLTQLLQSTTTLNAKQELVYRLRCQLLSRKALLLGYQHVFIAENSTRLAINILTNVAQGRGAHLTQDTGFTDGGRFSGCGVNLLRPLRDLSVKEIVMYNALHKVKTVFVPNLSTKQTASASIPTLTENFVQGLVSNFPSTEMTIYRTSNKVKPTVANKSALKCKLCNGFLDNNKSLQKASANTHLIFTKQIANETFERPEFLNQPIDISSFGDMTHVSDNCLCYSCSILDKELKEDGNLDNALDFIPTPRSAAQKENNVLEQLKDVLIED